MPTFCNLETNKFTEVTEDFLNDGYYLPVETAEGREVYVESNLVPTKIGSMVSGTIAKQEGLNEELEKAIKATWDACSDVIFADSPNAWRQFFIDDQIPEREIMNWVTICHLIERFARGKPKEVRKQVYLLVFATFHGQEPSTRLPNISNAWKRTIVKAVHSLDYVEASEYFDLNMDKLLQDHKENTAAVYLKAFNTKGVGFVVGRICRQTSSRIARFGMESGSAEEAEIKLLRHLFVAAWATNAGGHLDIFSTQKNIVHWLNGDSHPKTHLELREEIEGLLKANFESYDAHWMDEETRKAYKKQRAGQ